MKRYTVTNRTPEEQFARLTNPLGLTQMQLDRNEQSRQWIMRHEAAKRALMVREAIKSWMEGEPKSI